MQTVVPDLHWIDLGAVNAYLWTGAGGPSLIDTGFPWQLDRLRSELQSAGIVLADLKRILITHADLDHIGGLREIEKVSSAPVCCHAVEGEYVRGVKLKGPNPSLIGYLFRPGMLLARRYFHPGVDHVEELVIEGAETPEGFTVFHAPGHSPGQMALLHKERSVIIVGDALNHRNGRLGAPPAAATPKMGAARETIVKLGRLSYETACFGHGPPLIGGASAAIAAFGQTLN